MFEKILIANRGEIAVRIIKVCKEMGIKSVAIYSEADKDALHTKMADEAICIGPAPSGDSYLNMENIISAAVGTGAQAIHPGFGFLSENSLFAEKCKVCNITFIGPTPEVICKMGNKVEARNMMRNAGVPIISGSRTPVFDVCEAKKVALELGFPIMIKAAAGGGGKGMRISNTEDDFNENFVTAQMEANSSFRDGTMYLERYIEAPNHIEFQILADKYGNVIQLGERDCSIQRHHQKIIEEAPSPKLSVKLRKEMGLTQQQLGEMLGVQKSAIAKYENGRVPNLKKETLSRLAEIFNVTPNYLLGIDEPAYHGHSHNIDIPLYSDVCCGDGIFVEDNIEEYISLPESLLSSRKDYFCQYADGDSMIDENIQSGDLIIFEKTQQLNNGDVGCFGIEDNIATCKKYFNDSKQNCIILQPANDKYSPIIINEYNYHEFKIIGKLALVISKRN